MQSALYLATVLCKNIEPPLISLYFGGKIENWYSSLKQHFYTVINIKSQYLIRPLLFKIFKVLIYFIFYFPQTTKEPPVLHTD